MNTVSARSDVAVATTQPRVTPTPPRAARFGEVLSNTVVKSAESAMKMLPGSPVMAVAVRGATGAGTLNIATGGGGKSPEGPTNARSTVPGANLLGGVTGSAAAAAATGTGLPATTASTTDPSTGVESSLQHSQEMNLYFLDVQQRVNAENQQFTTLSNVMKAEHETVKTAIGNIR